MENFELNLKLTVAEAQVVLAGLGKLPLESVVSVWQSIKSQAEAQIQAASQAAVLTPAEEPASE